MCRSLLHFKNKACITGDIGYHYRTPIVIREKSLTLPFSNTALSLRCTTVGLLSMLYSFKTRQMPAMIEHFLEVDEVWKELLLVFQILILPTPSG